MENKSNVELFKQALSQGLSDKFDSVANECTGEIVCSKQHNLAMRTIIYGKTSTKRTWTPKTKRVVAILIAAALLLTSCAIIYRNEIREFIEEIYESFIMVNYSNGEKEKTDINETYELTYLPESYKLENSVISAIKIKYIFSSNENKTLTFEQRVLDNVAFFLDIENGYNRIVDIKNCDVYYKQTAEHNCYLWNDGQYSLRLISESELSVEELQKIINGANIK